MRLSAWSVGLFAVGLSTVAPAGAQPRTARPAHPAVGGGASATAPVAPNASPLRMAYVAGHRVRYVQRSVQNLSGATGQTVTTSTIEIETVTVHPDGTADQRLRVVAMDVTGAAIPAAARTAITHGMTGATIEFSQDGRGRITARHAPAGVSDEMRPMVDGVVQTMDQLAPQLPEEPVAVGSTWTDHQTIHLTPAPGATLDMTMDVTYTLRSLRSGTAGGGRAAVLGVNTVFSTPPGTNIQGMPLRGTGTTTGETTLDLGHGSVSGSRSTGSMTLHMGLQGRNLDIVTRLENELHTESPPR